ncbi:MAG: cytochrome c3 family protein [Chlorobiaceae bacterium]
MNRLLLVIIVVLFSPAANAATSQEQHASFNHSSLSTSAQCIRCHKRDIPDDNLHRKSQANCSTCHTTRQWKPTITEP